MSKLEERQKRHKKNRRITILVSIVVIFLLIVLLIITAFFLFKKIGEYRFNQTTKASSQQLQENMLMNADNNLEENYEEGQITYKGNTYEYNSEVITLLCLGVDNHNGIGTTYLPGDAGQADTILLIVLDSKNKELNLINVSRDTMVELQRYSAEGFYMPEEMGQLTLQYAYGNGRETSCELMVEQVSKLFYGIPIHGYGALGMNVIPELNDAFGGVTLTVIEDLSSMIPELKLGRTLTLTGEQAYLYVHYRNAESEELGTNNLRMARQKQYLFELIKQSVVKMKQDISLPVKMYQTASKNMVTDITVDRVTYLSTLVSEFTFTEENTFSVEGEVVRNDVHDEFYVDEAKLYELILEIFYNKID